MAGFVHSTMPRAEAVSRDRKMSFRIDRVAGGKLETVLRVSGRIQAEQVAMLDELAGSEEGKVAIDLREVSLVDRGSVRVLAALEDKGIELRDCPAYVREWMARES